LAKTVISMKKKKRIALIAHDNRKIDLLKWAKYNRNLLEQEQQGN
jgi:methylglyoxal synthase